MPEVPPSSPENRNAYDACLEMIAAGDIHTAKNLVKYIEHPASTVAKQQIRFVQKIRELFAERKFRKAKKLIGNLIQPVQDRCKELLDGHMQVAIREYVEGGKKKKAEKLEARRQKLFPQEMTEITPEEESDVQVDILPIVDAPEVSAALEAIDAERKRKHFDKKKPRGLGDTDRSLFTVLLRESFREGSRLIDIDDIARQTGKKNDRVKSFIKEARSFLLRDTGWELVGDAKEGIRLQRTQEIHSKDVQ